MKVTIVFHSVTGNSYLMAKTFYEKFKNKEDDVSLYRVADDDWQLPDDATDETAQHLKAMTQIPIATPDVLLESDIVVIGAPTYFGNVSAEMKAFMDATAMYWIGARYAGKKLAAFTSVANADSGGGLCLQAIHIYGQHMGMLSVPVPTTLLGGEICPAYGIVQCSQAQRVTNLDGKTVTAIDKFTEILLQYV